MLGKAAELSPSVAASSSKRKKPDDDAMSAMSSKKQRTRVSFSCGECHRRKQKCDRQVPCSHCVARKVPELCKAYTPGKGDQDLSARLSRLEQIIEVALPHYWNPRNNSQPSTSENNVSFNRRSPSLGDDDNRSQTEEQDPSGGTLQSGKWYGNSASGSVAPAYVIEQLQHVVSQANNRGGFSDDDILEPSGRQKGTMKLRSNGEVTDDDGEQSPEINLQSLFLECGVSPHQISELHQELPPAHICDRLINHYFSTINWTRYPISERDFRSAYALVTEHIQDGVGATNPHDVRFLPLLFVVLAISVRLAPETIAGDARSRRVTSLRYYWSSRRSLLIAAAIQPDSLDVVLTRLLSARFLTFDRRITECWSQLGAAVRTAQALGLHRDGSTLGMDAGQTEYRRRIWSYLLHADRSYALVLGRPNSIQDDYTSTKAPSNVEDDQLPLPEPRPLSQPTSMTFVILRHQLAIIIGRIVHHFQQIKERSQYSEVLVLDDELLKFMENLPPHFSFQPDTSLDQISTYIPVHRFLLITEILFVRISLHRPYLLKRLRSDRHQRSRKACFESAIKDFQVRQAFRECVSKEIRDTLSNAYREFQTAMISGLYFILEPQGPYSDTMHAILDGFMKAHESIQTLDETTRRELKTIEFLKAKASEMAKHDTTRMPSNMTKQEQQAHLLLNLHSPGTNKAFQALPSTSTDRSGVTPPFTSSSASASQLNLSPTFQRLQTSAGEFANSPTATGSPHGEDDQAQSLLDHWVSTVNNTRLDIATGAMSWGGPSSQTDFSGWAAMAGDPSTLPTLGGMTDASDWSYWEALVNQIQRAP